MMGGGQNWPIANVLFFFFFEGVGHFAGVQMVADKRGEGSKIAKICRRLKWMVPNT